MKCLPQRAEASLLAGPRLFHAAVVTSSVSCKVMINHLSQFGLIVLTKTVGTAVRT